MVQKLSESQINELLSFRFTTKQSPSPLSISMNLLQDEQALRDYLEELGKHIGAANEKVTASIFMKRYAFLAVIYLYAMTAWNRRLDISIENVSLESNSQDELWLPRFYFNEVCLERVEGDREKWREKGVKILFHDHLYPLIKSLTKITKVSKLILWENIAVYIYWLYETVLSKEDVMEGVAGRSQEDFHYLIFQAPGSLFGSYNENPLKRYYNQQIYLEELKREVRPRSTCCYSYLTKAKKRCVTCPHTCAPCPLISEMTRQEEQALDSGIKGQA
ncbi:IucA/IucC family C-terminal-domain containing protein [Bacillus sp. DTU_2020_1000418_1_SI_GHA_SEK_038]|uniref:IucA/IucC family C-terminal-domain containing protein n=1 Tax=Bacillus sp. DTU_2020_1000418_1_SI_GHA_SEK_038 TaxID=3077585 RepID=UPI0028EB0322|nr:IucA/IucC family C-terminal-domain containing protein [Bacillus sp. DTU_2020_1000418_1_SI_GHA_SEK_038]WNS74872.1 IucA/IucC family C-terminal-domain containing protein [Bacillus sp. DTU_2020_1000418_1_SI_GHA_SEK_038]